MGGNLTSIRTLNICFLSACVCVCVQSEGMQTMFTYLHWHAHRIRHWNRTGIILSMLFWLRVVVARNTNQICLRREDGGKIRLFVTLLRNVSRQCAGDDLNFKGYPNESFTCKSGFFCYFSAFLGISFLYLVRIHSLTPSPPLLSSLSSRSVN